MKYSFFRIRHWEIYIDLKRNRPWIIDLHRDKCNGDVSLWLAKMFILISKTKDLSP